MISTDLTIRLIEAFKKNNHKQVDSIIKEMIEISEKRKSYKVAKQLRNIYALPYSIDKSISSNFPTSSSLNFNKQDPDLLFEMRDSKVKLENIILSNDQIETFNEIKESYIKRDLLSKNGITSDNKILLYGPPGTGKTLFAYVLAGELKIPILHVYLDNLISSYLGETGKNIRRIFQEASAQDCLIFLDEFDAVGKQRDDNQDLGEFKRVIAVLLQNIDELNANNILIAATNHDHLLDKAVRRRFNYELNLDLLDEDSRKKLFALILKTYGKFNIDILGKISNNLSGAVIKQLVNKAVKKWFLNNKEGKLNEILIDELAYNFLRNNKLDTKNTDEVKIFVNVIKILWKNNRKKYTYKHLEDITKIPDSTLNNLIKQYE